MHVSVGGGCRNRRMSADDFLYARLRIGSGVSRAFIVEVFLIARQEAVMSREVIEETIIVGALTILEARELNLTGLLFFSFIDFLAIFRSVERVERVEYIELQSPDNISGIFDIPRLLEALEGNGVSVIGAIERADDDEGGIGVALKLLELANGIVNAELGGIAGSRNDLKVIEADDGSFGFVRAERAKQGK